MLLLALHAQQAATMLTREALLALNVQLEAIIQILVAQLLLLV